MTSTGHAPRGALLAEASSREARALVRWTASELEAIPRALGAALARSARRWAAGDRVQPHLAALDAAGAPAIHAEDADPALRAGAWTPIGVHAYSWIAVNPAQCLREALFGEAPVSPGARDGQRIADELAAECWTEQRAALQALLEEGLAGAPDAAALELDQAWRRWGGSVVIETPWFGTTWRLLLDATAVRGLLRALNLRRPVPVVVARGAPSPVLRALSAIPVYLQVRLAPVDIDLGSLMALVVGDVLQLDHAVDAPAFVVSPDAAIDAVPLCHGWLGGRDDRAAIELARPRSGARTSATS